MKKTITTLTVLIMCILQIQSQTIQLDDGACFGTAPTLTPTTPINGKNAYHNTTAAIIVYWDNIDNRWEVSTIPPNSFVPWYNTTASAPNPPQLGFGTWVNTGVGCNDLTQFNGTGTQTTLPVELIRFEGKISAKNILLNWQTASEINNEKFEIEESQNGREFYKIGKVVGNGTTLELQNYSFEVEHPRKGISYYRLKQIDFDGQFEYSKVISVNFRGDNGEVGEFYPNPSKSGLVNLDYLVQNDDEITVSVFDMTGKLMVNQIQSTARGNNNLRFDFSKLNTGVYIVKIGNERNPTHRKLIIKR